MADLLKPQLTNDDISRAIAVGEAEAFDYLSVWSGADVIATCYTPFLAVAEAALRAKTNMLPFTLNEELLQPWLIIRARPLPDGGNDLVAPTSVMLTPTKGSHDEKRAAAIRPSKTATSVEEYQNAMGAKFSGVLSSAFCPLDLLGAEREVWVGYESTSMPARVGSTRLPKR